MPRYFTIISQIFIMLIVSILVISTPVLAAPVSNSDLYRQPLTEISVDLGNTTNELKFFPDEIKLEAGKRYKITLHNPSPQKHYFTAKDFADVIWSQKVEAGKVEIKGAIHELELKPGAIAEWVLIPIKSGNYALKCTIPGHTEAGMIGQISIKI